MNDFERQVLADLAALKADMKWLIGNGHPGRLQELESRVAKHDAFVQRAGGIGAALAGLITLIHLAIDYLRVRH
jgi:hypothetical protein